MGEPRLLLYHAPMTRSSAMIWLLEEAGADYAIAQVDQGGSAKEPSYLALNPTGKVPTLVDRGPDGSWRAVVTETTAIAAYVAELYPDAGLAPTAGTAERAAWHTWMVLRGVAFEPALLDEVFPRQGEVPRRTLGWAPHAENLVRIEARLGSGPWLLGERFTTVDILVGSLLLWLRGWGKLDPSPALDAYLGRLSSRPAKQRADAKDDAGKPA